ncbi:PhnD/SsuA/transferrin family substrate-binding protein [Spiroplasma clarkii]|uniref:PhnD/SsuA/transferrin family substrate-binding protein n=1 Tax=Spiroplasma clarkii TaxID=2139 RepID=UPI001649BD0A|nr:PhnD/SsuA/transferrin family substrate-binding protein [Spiroplasma clarkii]
MKKLLLIFASASVLSAPAASVVACGGTPELRIAFVPSQKATEVTATVSKLESKLEAEMKKHDKNFSRKVKITTATNYEAAGNAMKKGKTDLAFLPVNTYESYRGDVKDDGTYSDAGILLVASRKALTAESAFPSFQTDDKFDDAKAASSTISTTDLDKLSANYNDILNKQINISGEANSKKLELNPENIKKVLFDSKGSDVSYYRSYIYANKDFVSKTLGENVPASGIAFTTEQLKSLVDKAVKDKAFGLGESPTSSASVLYPLHWLKHDLGYSNEEIKKVYETKELQKITVMLLKG